MHVDVSNFYRKMKDKSEKDQEFDTQLPLIPKNTFQFR